MVSQIGLSHHSFSNKALYYMHAMNTLIVYDGGGGGTFPHVSLSHNAHCTVATGTHCKPQTALKKAAVTSQNIS